MIKSKILIFNQTFKNNCSIQKSMKKLNMQKIILILMMMISINIWRKNKNNRRKPQKNKVCLAWEEQMIINNNKLINKLNNNRLNNKIKKIPKKM